MDQSENSICVKHRGVLDALSMASPSLIEELLASIPEAVAIANSERVILVNAAFTRIFGYTAEEMAEGSLQSFIIPEERRNEDAQVRKTVDRDGFASLETVRRNKRGDLVNVAVQAGPLVLNGVKAGYVVLFRDIRERKRLEAKLQHDAMHDPLTGLPNRALFMDRLGLAFSRRARRHGLNCGVLFVDLDNFKEINDTLGHAAGDELLMSIAERLRSALRPQDTAARLGGDEFGVLVENIQSIHDAEIIANRIVGAMNRPFKVLGRSVHSGVSVGVAVAGPDQITPELLIRDADYAMYRAKQEGGGRFEVFDKPLQVQVARQQEHERELRRVLDERSFEICYEPIYWLKSGKLEGFESLLHWRRSDGETQSFDGLLSFAEEAGLSVALGQEMLETACRQLRSWSEAYPHANLSLAINLTRRQFLNPDLVSQVKTTLSGSRVNPAKILFEVEENTLNENPDAAAGILYRLVDYGARVTVDNFGSGLAPLNHLARLPIDVLKLDPALTMCAPSEGRQVALLESLIHLGRNLGVEVVAQGIGTREQLDALCRMGCELGQGVQLSPALVAAQAERLVEREYGMVVAGVEQEGRESE